MNTKRPVLFDFAQQDNSGLTIEDLKNQDHPVNIKGQSGKRSGMAVMIKGRIYVAQGSNPKANWVCLNDNTSYPSVLKTDNGLLNTTLSNKGIQNHVNLSNVDPLYPDQGSYLKPVSGKYGFSIKEKGTYRVELFGVVSCDEISKAMTPVEFVLNKKRAGEGGFYDNIHSSHCITELMMLDDGHGDHLAATFNIVDYLDAEEGAEYVLMARSSIAPITFRVTVALIRAEKLF